MYKHGFWNVSSIIKFKVLDIKRQVLIGLPRDSEWQRICFSIQDFPRLGDGKYSLSGTKNECGGGYQRWHPQEPHWQTLCELARLDCSLPPWFKLLDQCRYMCMTQCFLQQVVRTEEVKFRYDYEHTTMLQLKLQTQGGELALTYPLQR